MGTLKRMFVFPSKRQGLGQVVKPGRIVVSIVAKSYRLVRPPPSVTEAILVSLLIMAPG